MEDYKKKILNYTYRSTNKIMLLVIFASIPGMCTQLYFFGYGVCIQIFLSIFFSILFEIFIKILRKQNVKQVFFDNSATLTGVLIGVSLPSLSPWWLSCLGSFFSIIIAKQIYGGLGNNIFNPAMCGYAILLISFPILMTNWSFQNSCYFNLFNLYDVLSVIFFTDMKTYLSIIDKLQISHEFVTQATPLEMVRTNFLYFKNIYLLFNLDYSFQCWKWILINISFLLGGIILLFLNVICWRIPVSILLTLFIFSMLDCYLCESNMYFSFFQLFFGSTMLSAFFIATDPVTTSITNVGRVIFGIMIGFLVWLIRTFGGYPDAIAFSILLSNSIVPLLDYYIQPRVYGYVKKK
ncbi:MAG: RnfABCDGE type electron transport complex subunit D [Buchnera aphidicola (Chaetogeoica yunlongensis)]